MAKQKTNKAKATKVTKATKPKAKESKTELPPSLRIVKAIIDEVDRPDFYASRASGAIMSVGRRIDYAATRVLRNYPSVCLWTDAITFTEGELVGIAIDVASMLLSELFNNDACEYTVRLKTGHFKDSDHNDYGPNVTMVVTCMVNDYMS